MAPQVRTSSSESPVCFSNPCVCPRNRNTHTSTHVSFCSADGNSDEVNRKVGRKETRPGVVRGRPTHAGLGTRSSTRALPVSAWPWDTTGRRSCVTFSEEHTPYGRSTVRPISEREQSHISLYVVTGGFLNYQTPPLRLLCNEIHDFEGLSMILCKWVLLNRDQGAPETSGNIWRHFWPSRQKRGGAAEHPTGSKAAPQRRLSWPDRLSQTCRGPSNRLPKRLSRNNK